MIKKLRKERLFELYRMTHREGVSVGYFREKLAAYIGEDVGIFVIEKDRKDFDRLMVAAKKEPK